MFSFLVRLPIMRDERNLVEVFVSHKIILVGLRSFFFNCIIGLTILRCRGYIAIELLWSVQSVTCPLRFELFAVLISYLLHSVQNHKGV